MPRVADVAALSRVLGESGHRPPVAAMTVFGTAGAQSLASSQGPHRRLWRQWLGPLAAGLLAFALMAGPASTNAAVPARQLAKVAGAFAKSAKALPEDEIVDLARIARQPGGLDEVGKILGARKLPNEVLEDTYLRIAVQQEKIPRSEADGMFARLRGTDGFRTTLRKVVSNSDVKTAGHLNELRIADTAAQYQFTVKGLGKRFDDGLKQAATDIDVLLQKDWTVFAIEAKDYASTTPIPIDAFRADMDSLVIYVTKHRKGRVVPVFSLTNRPGDENVWRLLQLEAERRGVHLIDGTPLQQIEQIRMLYEILG